MKQGNTKGRENPGTYVASPSPGGEGRGEGEPFLESHFRSSIQSTNMNSFESSNTCAYFSQGDNGLGGGSGGPLKSFFAFHSVT